MLCSVPKLGSKTKGNIVFNGLCLRKTIKHFLMVDLGMKESNLEDFCKSFQSSAAVDLSEDWPVAVDVPGVCRRMRRVEHALKGAKVRRGYAKES